MFLDELIDPFFEEVGSGYRDTFERCQLFRCQLFIGPVMYLDEERRFWRPAEYTRGITVAELFRMITASTDAYSRKSPLHAPKLKSDKEFPVVRAKGRPFILLSSIPEPSPPCAGTDRHLHKKVGLVAPIQSAVKATGESKFKEEIIERIRKLEFLHLLFLLPHAGAIDRYSLLRLDLLQTTFLSHLEPINCCLCEDAQGVVTDMLQAPLSGESTERLEFVRESLQEE